MPLADSKPIFQPDADLRFEVLIAKPAAAIALITAVVLTAITWITTFLVTVSSVAAYLTQNAALAAEEPAWNIASLVSAARTVSAPTTLAQADSGPDESALPSFRPPQIVTADRTLKTPALREPLVEESTSAIPLAAQIIETRVEGATTQLSRVTQDPLTSVVTQPRPAAAAVAHPAPAQEPCIDAIWNGICRERMRWAHCHPDKWDNVPECVVQKFDVSYSVN